MHPDVPAAKHPDIHVVYSLVGRGLKQCLLLEEAEVMSLCFPQLRGATSTQSPKGLWPSQLMGTPVLSKTF